MRVIFIWAKNVQSSRINFVADSAELFCMWIVEFRLLCIEEVFLKCSTSLISYLVMSYFLGPSIDKSEDIQ